LYAQNAPDVDAYSSLPSCIKDNTIEFASNGDYLYDEGPTKCKVMDAQTQYGSWVLSADETQIIVTFNGSKKSYVIQEFTNQVLRLRFSFASTNGFTLMQDNTYKLK